MSDNIFFDGVKYISANDAATSSGFTRDYIGKLCRTGKVKERESGKIGMSITHRAIVSGLARILCEVSDSIRSVKRARLNIMKRLHLQWWKG